MESSDGVLAGCVAGILSALVEGKRDASKPAAEEAALPLVTRSTKGRDYQRLEGSRPLLNHSTFRTLDKPNQQGDIFAQFAFGLQFR